MRTNDMQIFATHDEACEVARQHKSAVPKEFATANQFAIGNGMTVWVVARHNGWRFEYLRDDGSFN
jgi:hypothetical protein